LDVCLSFAGEQREFVQEVAGGLREAGVRVFYDEYEKAKLWGQNLYTYLEQIYRKSARYCVIFASSEYKRKLWPSHELRMAQSRAFTGCEAYILPARFDDTEIPGIPPTIGYIDLRTTSPRELVKLIVEKIASM